MNTLKQIHDLQNSSFLNAQKQSYIEPEKEPLPRCPICGEELGDGEKIYTNKNTDYVVGCEHCLDNHDADVFL